jgi:primosomal protein N'
MKPIGVMSTAALFLLLGIAAPANGRQEKPKEEAKPQKQEQQAKPEKQQPQAKAPKQEQQAKAPKQEQQAKPEKQQQQAQAPKQQQQHASPEKQQQQAKSQQPQNGNSAKQPQHSNSQQQQAHQQQASSSHAPQRTQQAMATQRSQPALRLSARGSGRIPDDRFHANFGRGHDFHMGNPVLVGGYSRFQYGGFWFGFVQPWPAGWYYTDDVYIDYVDGGYYMYNPYYPGARFSISVVI